MKRLRLKALTAILSALRSAGRSLLERMRVVMVLVGKSPALSRHHDLDAWSTLAERGVRRRPKPRTGTGRKIVPLRGSVDDPHVRVRITM